ncbi:MAG: ABC transporter ATP-binding protein [Desulfobacterales bacterium]|nr:ABC transporter ATP-binding protein [Desulfobacterales bacterium]
MTDRLELKGIYKYYGPDQAVLRDIHLCLEPGTKLSILGPSGSGKTTLLRIIAGLESIDRGELLFDNRPLAPIPPHKRNFGYMFQDFALFPHMDVRNNVAFGLKMAGMAKKEQNKRVDEMLELTTLTGYGKRRVDDLSGGERQRVALARTLAPKPRLLMLDEPLSALDRALRHRLLKELTQIISRLKITTLFVTHDHDEAFTAGNRILVMKDGAIQQEGSRDELIQCPATPWVEEFLSPPE